MTLNLSQLYELRTNVKQNTNKVVSKNAFLALLDSHISVLSGKNDLHVIRDTNEYESGLQRVYDHYALDSVRLPPTIEERNKAYGH